MRGLLWLPFALLAMALVATNLTAAEIESFAEQRDLPRERVVSGFEFLTSDTQALQRDDFANPGGLWRDKGERLFAAADDASSCASCHAASGDRPLAGAATRYPTVDAQSGELLNLEGRINACRERYQRRAPLPYESDDLLALSAYVAGLSHGMPYRVVIDGAARPFFDAGRAYFFVRKGQLNLACSQCHDTNAGKWLRGERISQGQPTAFPGYRLEWQRFGSLHRRLQDCDAGVRATRQSLGSPTYLALELYLAWRAGDLPIESPGVRR